MARTKLVKNNSGQYGIQDTDSGNVTLININEFDFVRNNRGQFGMRVKGQDGVYILDDIGLDSTEINELFKFPSITEQPKKKEDTELSLPTGSTDSISNEPKAEQKNKLSDDSVESIYEEGLSKTLSAGKELAKGFFDTIVRAAEGTIVSKIKTLNPFSLTFGEGSVQRIEDESYLQRQAIYDKARLEKLSAEELIKKNTGIGEDIIRREYDYGFRDELAEKVINAFDKIRPAKLEKGTSDIVELISRDEDVTEDDVKQVSRQIGDGLGQLSLIFFPAKMKAGGMQKTVKLPSEVRNGELVYRDLKLKNLFGDITVTRGLATGNMLSYGSNYMSRLEQSLDLGKSLKEADEEARTGAIIETGLENLIGIEGLIAKGIGKKFSQEAIEKITKSGLTQETFGELASELGSKFSFKNLGVGLIKGITSEAFEEFLQEHIDAAEQDLFDLHEKARKKGIKGGQLFLYDPEDKVGFINSKGELTYNKNTFFQGLNAAFYGGVLGAVGGGFSGSVSFNPSIYSSLQREYDNNGAIGLTNAKKELVDGINKALEDNKMTLDEANNALKNIDSIESNILKFQQNSDINPYARFQVYNIQENLIPNLSNIIANEYVEALGKRESASDEQIKLDLSEGNYVEVSYETEAQVPEDFKPYIPKLEGEDAQIRMSVPKSVYEAYVVNQQQESILRQEVADALDRITSATNQREVTIEDLLRIGNKTLDVMTDPSKKMELASVFNKKKRVFQSFIRGINYLKESINNVSETGVPIASQELIDGLINTQKLNPNQQVFYNNRLETIEEISTNGQSIKLKGIEGEISSNQVKTELEVLADRKLQQLIAEQAAEDKQAEIDSKPEEEVEIVVPEEESDETKNLEDAGLPLSTFAKAVFSNKLYTYDGKRGQLYSTPEGKILFESATDITEIGDINDLAGTNISDFGIVEGDVSVDNDNTVQIGDETFTNEEENPLDSITYNNAGDAISVRLKDKDGKIRKFAGATAQMIDLNYKLNQLENELEKFTEEQLEKYAEQQREIIKRVEESNKQPADKGTTKGRGRPPKKKRITLKTKKQLEADKRRQEAIRLLNLYKAENLNQSLLQIKLLNSSLASSGITAKSVTPEEMQELTGSISQGMFIAKDGKIYLNEKYLMTEWGSTVVFHEGVHPIINIIRNVDSKYYNNLISAINKEAETNQDISNVRDAIQASEEYTTDEQRSDELLVEVIARVASGRLSLEQTTPSFKQKVIDFLNRIAKSLGFNQILSDTGNTGVFRLANQISDVLNSARDISEIVGEENVDKFQNDIQEIQPSIINRASLQDVNVNPEGHNLSFVKESDVIDIVKLINEISEKNQKVWFWVADQLGRGMYFDEVVNGEHFLDAGISYALDPENRNKRAIWASGASKRTLENNIAKSDYIFIISGSKEKSKLFNRRVFDVLINRNKDYEKFRNDLLSVSKINDINKILNAYNSWDELRQSTSRKELLLLFNEQKSKETPLKKLLEEKNAFLDTESMRDGFLVDNDFDMNDIMLVLKAERVGDKSSHSTYEYDLIGDVIGVPDKRINAFDILPEDVRGEKELKPSQQSQKIAPYGSGIRQVSQIQKSDISREDLERIETSIEKIENRKTDEVLGLELNGIKNVPTDVMMNFLHTATRDYSTVDERNRIEALKKSFIEKGWQSEDYANSSILLEVDVNGNAWIGEGNHRLIALNELGVSKVPVRTYFGMADSGRSFLNYETLVANPTSIISPQKIKEFKDIVRYDYHIKYLSIYQTDLAKETLPQKSDINRQFTVEDTIKAAGLTVKQVEKWEKENIGDWRKERVSEVLEAQKKLEKGDITFEEYLNVRDEFMPIVPFNQVPKIPEFIEIMGSLKKNQLETGVVGVNKVINDGQLVATRLDIPAYNNYNVFAVSIHNPDFTYGDNIKDKSIGYSKTAILTDVTFKTKPLAAFNIATGTSKATIARMQGRWQNVEPEQAAKMAKDAMENSDYIQVGMNPFRNSFFYNKATGEAVVSADEVIQVGALVLAKNPVIAPFGSPAFKNHFTFTNKRTGNEMMFSQIDRREQYVSFVASSLNDFTRDEIIDVLMSEEKLSRFDAANIYDEAITFLSQEQPIEVEPINTIEEEDRTDTPKTTINKIVDYINTQRKKAYDKQSKKEKKDNAFITKWFDSQYNIRTGLESLTDGQPNKASARLQLLRGVSYRVSSDLNAHIKRIYNNLNEDELNALDILISRNRVIQVDKIVERKYNALVEKYKQEGVENAESEARKKHPFRKYGKTFFNGREQFLSSEIALQEIESIKQELGEDVFNKLQERVEEYKNVGNEIIKEMFDSGVISKSVFEEYKDDFYQYTRSIDSYIESEDLSNFNAFGKGRSYEKAWGELSKEGTENTLETDSIKLLITGYARAIEVIQRNRFHQSVFDLVLTQTEGLDTIKPDINGDKITFIKPANYKLNKSGTKSRTEAGFVIEAADEGFINVKFKKNGETVAYQMRVQEYMELMNLDMKKQHMGGMGKSAIDITNQILTAGATRYNLFFFLRNVSMDLMQQVYATDEWTGKTSNILYGGIKALAQSIKNTGGLMVSDLGFTTKSKENLEDLIRLGGAQNLLSTSDEISVVEDYKKKLNKLEKSVKSRASKSYIQKYYNYVKQSFKNDIAYLNTRTELGMRLSFYEQSLKNSISQFKDKNNRAPSEKELEEIKEIAAAKTRDYTDFAQRGTFTPHSLPYLNAAIQPFANSIKYTLGKETRKRALGKLGMVTLYAGILELLSLLKFGDDELDKYSEYEKQGNTMIYTGLGYAIKIANLPFLMFNTELGKYLAKKIYYAIEGKEEPLYENTVIDNLEYGAGIINKITPIPFLPSKFGSIDEAIKSLGGNIASRLPLASSAVTYATGFDAFRNRFVVSDYDKIEFPTKQEELGRYNQNIPYFYKVLGDFMGASPAILQASVEKITTSPTVNPYIGASYIALSNIANYFNEAKTKAELGKYASSESPDDLIGNILGRVISKADPERKERQLAGDAYIKAKKEEDKYNAIEKNTEELFKEKYEESPDTFDVFVRDYISKNKIEDNNYLFDTIERIKDKILTGKDPRDLIPDKEYTFLRPILYVDNEAAAAKLIRDASKKKDGSIDREREDKLMYYLSEMKMSSEKSATIQSLLDSDNPIIQDKKKEDNNVLKEQASIINTSGMNISEIANDIIVKAGEKYNLVESKVKGAINKGKELAEFVKKEGIDEASQIVRSAYQRYQDKKDESGKTSDAIVIPSSPIAEAKKEFSLTNGYPVVASDTTNLGNLRTSNSDYQSVSSIVDLNKVDVGSRNRGDKGDIMADLVAQFLRPFNPKGQQESYFPNGGAYVGIKGGQIILGSKDDVKEADVNTNVPFTTATYITGEYVNPEGKYKFPKIIDKDGNQSKQILNISLSAGGADDANNRFAGGAVIFETPDKKHKYLVRGSLKQVKEAFNDLKEGSGAEYLNLYILDNGSFSTGLFTKDGKSSEEEIKAYERKNVNGSHSIYIKSYKL